MTTPGWDFPDAWLMISAAGFVRRGCDLSHLIGTADAYNHDIPSQAQVERSIGRLVASGLATTSDLRVRLSKQGRALAKQAHGGMFERAPNLLLLLSRWPLREGRWALPQGAWQAAYDQYRSRMAKDM